MKYSSDDPLLLLGYCSYCGDDFGDGVARFVIGDFPYDQFCSYLCAEKFLKFDLGKEHRSIPAGPAIFRPDSLLRREQGKTV